MRFADAKAMMEARGGYVVCWQQSDGYVLHSDFTPDVRHGEPAFETVQQAWDWADDWALIMKPEGVVNVRVVYAATWEEAERPVAESAAPAAEKGAK